jgi:two-component system, NarL family, sensor kinase
MTNRQADGVRWTALRPIPDSARSDEATAVLILMEQGLLARFRRLQASERRLRGAVARAQRAAGRQSVRQVERERQRLGRELHTGVGQLLAAMRMQLEIVQDGLGKPPVPVALALDRIDSLAAEALEQVRTISRGFYPPQWQRLSMDAALRHLWESSGGGLRFAGGVRVGGACDTDPETKALLFRAAQEGMSNVIRHARATRVDVALENMGGRLVLTVQDDGIGFDTAAPMSGGGIGLYAIREDMAALGGKLLVASGASGTKLEVTIPLPS